MIGRFDHYLDRQVPRYTSYPTAPHFHDGVDAECYGRWLSELSSETTFSLYFHVPFCTRMCWYCGCHTRVVNRYDPIERYARTLRDEMTLVGDRVSGSRRVTGLHFGGGTPTMLSADDFKAMAARARSIFDVAPDAEFAVEMDPRTVTEELAETLAVAGVNRASLGVQDFDPDVQKAINRIQPYETTARVAEILRTSGISRLSFDLMYGLPRQDVARIVDTVDRAVSLMPDRIALFGYAHVPWMKKHQQMIPEDTLPGGSQRQEQFEAAAERLIDHGYIRVGLDHFARPADDLARVHANGTLKRNFQGYTVEPAEVLLGFGASSIGSLPQGYVQNQPTIAAYRESVEEGRLPIVRGFALTAYDRVRRDVIERLMCDDGVELDVWTGRYGLPSGYFDDAIQSLAPLAMDGLVSIKDRRISVAEDGKNFVRLICAAFDEYLETGQARHSRAV